MAAGPAGKVPGAPPGNPTDARSRDARRREKQQGINHQITPRLQTQLVEYASAAREKLFHI